VSRGARIGLALALVGGALAGLWWGGRRGPHPEPARAGGLHIVQCPIHGIAYDLELEACPECAKSVAPPSGRV
jgi:hypothetical protein